ncbi:mannose-1-phosphate guanylyltransferase/mannose-6-phosphate isomerase [Brucellaceae bacterium C25G]
MSFVPVIISGGVGSRLWPLSRDAHPKPFIELPQGGTLIGRTYQRAAALKDATNIITVTNRDFLFLTLDAYADMRTDTSRDIFLLEPQGRDTAAAIALATLHAKSAFGGDTILLILPSDHLIQDQDAFSVGVERAKELAASGRIVTFGIVPESPETGFGYLETEQENVLRFVEKPDEETARAYLESGRYFWNSGMFCFKADAMIAAMRDHCPDILQGAEAALAKARHGHQGDAETFEVDNDLFAATPAISIDYAVMEKQANIACVPLDCGWSDIGSWSAMAELVEADQDGNRVSGEAVLENTHGSFVYSEDRLVSLIGVDDLLVVDTADALLVTHKDQAQQVRTVYNRLKKQNHEAAKLHRTAHRPWGTYTVLEEGDNFKIKRIVVKPGSRLSLQSHHHRSEHWIVVSGTAKVTNGDNEILLTTNQSTYIPCGHKHRLENPGILPLVLIEVQSGEYLGEDDIVRFDDIYGRS